MIYLDNAATSFPKPPEVIKATLDCIKNWCGNSGRSSHALSMKTGEKIYKAREAVCELLSAPSPERVIFTSGATAALNIAIKTTVLPETHVLISDMEHNSTLRPICKLKRTCGVSYSVFNSTGNLAENIEKLIKSNTKYIVTTVKSNVTGKEIPLNELSELARRHSLKLIIDASQMIGHKNINLINTPCDLLAAPAHKGLFGLQGAGFLVISDDTIRDSFLEGGSGNESKKTEMPENLPERFEAGTLPSPAIVSLLSGIEYIKRVGLSEIEEKLDLLTERYIEVIRSIKKAVLYECESGIISFNIGGIPAEIVASELNKRGICVRAGLHCAPIAHKKLGTQDIGTVRISLSYLNSFGEADAVYKALRAL